jgi:hypothetical protein
MKPAIYYLTSRISRVLANRQFAERPAQPGLRQRLANFIADIGKSYAEKKKTLSPKRHCQKICKVIA